MDGKTQRRKTYSLAEIRCHTTVNDCWIIIDKKVYDVSKWLKHHPGGILPLLYSAGQDCTSVFKAFHPFDRVRNNKLPAFCIGDVEEPEECPVKESFICSELKRINEEIVKEGGYKTHHFFYFKNAVVLCLLLSFVLYCLVMMSSSTTMLFVAAIAMGFFFQQIAFVGHDAGHHLITHDHDTDEAIGILVGNILSGISIGWWKRSHNAHHVVTNSVNGDPDIQHLPVFAVTDKFFQPVISLYHEKTFSFDKISKFFVSNQHLLYYLIMGLARYNLYAQSVIHIFTRTSGRKRKIELIGMGIFFCWFATLCSIIPSFGGRFIFVFVSHFIAGLLHIQITLSHFSMSTYHGMPANAYNSDTFFKSQMATTLNVSCSPYMDFFHGGLQFQIEHHLFPRCSRPYLRTLSRKVQHLCKDQGVAYVSLSFYEANKTVILALKETAQKAQKISSLIWDGINAVG